MGTTCSTYGAIRSTYSGFSGKNLKEEDHLEDEGIDRIILKLIFERLHGRACTGSIWLRIGTGGGLL